MRERGRERVRGADPRATLGQTYRSPPSPEVRHKRGGESVDSGEWTEVSYRRWKELREADRGNNRIMQNMRYQRRSASITGYHSLHDDRSWPNHLSRDHDPVRRN
ncbi:hypothetical protein A2U01_0056338, partial [Trifolium medium]|nr:hypothetical protein [Trifolium medium]